MNCNVKNCGSTDLHHIWKCNGTCGRSFHAACVGAKRDWEDFLRNHVLPLCSECAPVFIQEADIKHLLQQQLESQHKILQQLSKIQILHETIDGLEHRVVDLQLTNKKMFTAMTALTKQRASANLSDEEIDTLAAVVEQKNALFLKTFNEKMAKSFCNLEEILESHQNTLLDLTVSAEKCPAIESLEEVKALSAAASRPSPATPECRQNLAEELANSNKTIVIFLNRIQADAF